VKPHWNWPNGASGVIAEPPTSVQSLTANSSPWKGHLREVRGRNKTFVFVWVRFDETQRDGDNDGPYAEGEVDIDNVELQ
jgi:hypothetical protein